jgi:hypothetical protein
MTGYYDVPKTRFTCNNCQWSGLGAMLAQGEVFQAVVEYDCPQCGEKVTFAAFPTREDTAAAAQTGSEEAARELARFGNRDRRWERVLETQGSAVLDPPELAERDIYCELSLEYEADGTWLVLTANGCELHRELGVFESTEPAHRLLAVMRERYGDRVRSFNYKPALLYLGGDRRGAFRELDGLVSNLPEGDGRPPEEAGSYFVIQDAGDPAPWALVAVRPRGLYEMWTGTEWVDMPFFASYFVGGEIGARQIEPAQVEAMKATIKPPPPAAVAMMRGDDASRWMLATKSSQHPEHWLVTVVDPNGRRTLESGEAGKRHIFPALWHSRNAEIPWMWPVGDHACHMEIVDRDTGDTVQREVPFVTCPHLDPPDRDDEARVSLDPDAIKTELRQRLSELRPRHTWASVVADADIWQRTEDTWDLLDPPEDHALPPALPWSEETRQLSLSEYRAIFEKFLEPGGYYDLTWPPEGFLSSPGDWHVTDPELCSEHGDDYADGCEECQRLDRTVEVVVDQDATWEWSVEVETWGPEERSDGTTSIELLETDRWTIGYTDVDPREVEYGPHKGSPARAEMVERYWRAVRESD